MKNLLDKFLNKFLKQKEMSQKEFKELTRCPEMPLLENILVESKEEISLDNEINQKEDEEIN